MSESICKTCRRQGTKLFLRGEKCFSQKCPVVRKPYLPGPKRKGRMKAISEYGKELKEKQKLKNWYGLREKQFSNYVKKVLSKRGRVENAEELLIKSLESRLDNVIFRLGFSPSRAASRQLVSHRHFLINGRPLNIPSYSVKKGDIIRLNPKSAKKQVFQNLNTALKKYKAPSWLELNLEKLEGKVLSSPTFEEAAPPADLLAIFEFYSR